MCVGGGGRGRGAGGGVKYRAHEDPVGSEWRGGVFHDRAHVLDELEPRLLVEGDDKVLEHGNAEIGRLPEVLSHRRRERLCYYSVGEEEACV